MKTKIENFCHSKFDTRYKRAQGKGKWMHGLTWFSKVILVMSMIMLTMTNLYSQVSGNWDSYSTDGSAGYVNLGGGVINLLSDGTNTCAAAAVHETTNRYNTSSAATFSKCYQVFFGCPGNDNIGSDINGDGVAFSFWPSTSTYNISNGLACGGGLGYMGAMGNPPSTTTKMLTIEFDTYSSAFDGTYGGGTTGFNDEISLHKDGDAGTSGLVTPGVNAGNLEDGLEHTICITYNPTSKVLSVSIDGTMKFSYTYDLQTYFGAGVLLNQTWSSGKYGATNPTTVSDETGTSGTIASKWGAPFCPSTVVITSPNDGDVFGLGCSVGPITITADAFPPAGNTVTKVEFFLDGSATPLATDLTAPYSVSYTPTSGSHTVTAKAYWSGGATTNTTTVTNFSVTGSVQSTSTVPNTSNGIIDAIWSSYTATSLTKGNGASGTDLSATYKTMWDNTNLYVLVDVTDDVASTTGTANWEKDGVEIYIDLGDNGAGAYGTDDNQYTFVYGGAVSASLRSPASITGVTFEKVNKTGPTGYFMEIKFPWTALGGSAPAVGTSLGFDVSINDDDNGGAAPARDNQLSWNDGTYAEWNNATLFGSLAFSSCNPLPISLLSFTGRAVNETVVLNWNTVVEINNEKFIIQRSSDLSEWESIGVVAGAGNSTTIMNYTFTDYAPLEGVGYYRLLQVDYNGMFSYSNVVAVEINAHHISISPNPFEDAIIIKSDIDGDMDVTIYDAIGRLLYHAIMKSNNGIVSLQPDLSSGAYLITIQTESLIEHHKVIKK